MLGTVGKYILRCETCHRAKLIFHKGEYKPLLAAEKPWEHVSMDFTVALPRTRKGKDAIMVVVDRFSKMAHFITSNKVDDAKHVAKLYFSKIVKFHAIPKSIVSDIDNRFLSSFWGALWRFFDTKLLFSTSHHPQKNGQTEFTNKTLSNILRAIVSKHTRDCDEKLCHAEFSYNTSPSSATSFLLFNVFMVSTLFYLLLWLICLNKIYMEMQNTKLLLCLGFMLKLKKTSFKPIKDTKLRLTRV